MFETPSNSRKLMKSKKTGENKPRGNAEATKPQRLWTLGRQQIIQQLSMATWRCHCVHVCSKSLLQPPFWRPSQLWEQWDLQHGCEIPHWLPIYQDFCDDRLQGFFNFTISYSGVTDASVSLNYKNCWSQLTLCERRDTHWTGPPVHHSTYRGNNSYSHSHVLTS